MRRIEATHSGFVYQHLFGAAHLLLANTDAASLYVERDEDIEIETSTRFWYTQVKHLADPLQPSHVEDILVRFNLLRAEHAAGKRTKAPSFAIVSSSEVSASLRTMSQSAAWPSDVSLVTP
ncbi:MAG TPA: hypothetical protein VK427_06145 [Kofleriaceae bacterium]|nr:hypothetical protein [Kofleriaceae bacterium]